MRIAPSLLNRQRLGTVTVLSAFLLPVLLVISAFTINIAFLQLTKTELMVATDAAARAGGRGISAYQDIDLAMDVAANTAQLNTVNGVPFNLNKEERADEIAFGGAEPYEGSDRFLFEKHDRESVRNGNKRAEAIQITGKMGGGYALTSPVEAFFPTFGMKDSFELRYQAVAMQVDRDIALILDRSGSMGWHPGYNWPSEFEPFTWNPVYSAYLAGLLSYYNGYFYYNSGQDSETLQDWIWTNYLGLGEAPKRPWEELEEAVDVFLTVLESTDQEERVSVASYATSATLDITLQTTYDPIRQKIATLVPDGWTAIGEGMEEGIPSLLDSFARPYAQKTLLVMTDGVHNLGSDPATVAETTVENYDITIHSITFGSGADQTKMQTVADIGGGDHYHAADAEQLNDVMEEIANNLPTIVTQ